ncbi:uncharacterized protein LOC114305092 [Camellia sinensis]|uniref:uncharacterized protein LOC114305092 n=1 Tax=Camellia sinensis TaxID=4442 RepID=UPI0010361771|nr:uncharacterized protein LOC114305092 [Camellia sinensis]
MASNSLYDMLVNDSDLSESNDDLEMLKAVTMDEELLDSEIGSSSRRGFVRGRKVIHRDHIQGHERLFLDYFAESPVYPPELFRRRFRMKRSLFLRIQVVVEAHDRYFLQKRNCAGKLGLSSLQKITVALRMLAYGVAADFIDEYIWHAFFGLPGSHNDINVLERSFVFTELAQGRAPAINYTINGNEYTMGYYLANGIYPQWSTFVKTIPSPQGNKKKLFAAAQEATRKDVERAFGVLQARFAIVHRLARFWNTKMLKYIMKACIILHNMIIEDERDDNGVKDFNYDQIDDSPHVTVLQERTTELMAFIQCHHNIRDRQTHSHLQSDLVEHLWQLHSEL